MGCLGRDNKTRQEKEFNEKSNPSRRDQSISF